MTSSLRHVCIVFLLTSPERRANAKAAVGSFPEDERPEGRLRPPLPATAIRHEGDRVLVLCQQRDPVEGWWRGVSLYLENFDN